MTPPGADDFDSEAEDRELLAGYLAGPGARPTEADRKRWLVTAHDGHIPRLKRRAES